MAKSRGRGPRERRPSLRGGFYSYDKGDGIVVSAWPPKRGKPKSAAQLHANELMRQAAQAYKAQPAEITQMLNEATAGTPFLGRDLAMRLWYGAFPSIQLTNGKVLRSMPTRVNMSDLLDNLAWVPGSLLGRDTDLWMPIAPGADGKVLTAHGEGVLPTWETPAAPTGAGTMLASSSTTGGSVNTAAFACKGNSFEPETDIDIAGIAWMEGSATTLTAAAIVAELSGTGSTGTLVATNIGTPISTVGGGAAGWLRLPFATPIRVSPGKRYMIGAVRQSSGPTTSLDCYAVGSPGSKIPLPGSWQTIVRIPSIAPAAGDAYDTNGLAAAGILMGVYHSFPS